MVQATRDEFEKLFPDAKMYFYEDAEGYFKNCTPRKWGDCKDYYGDAMYAVFYSEMYNLWFYVILDFGWAKKHDWGFEVSVGSSSRSLIIPVSLKEISEAADVCEEKISVEEKLVKIHAIFKVNYRYVRFFALNETPAEQFIKQYEALNSMPNSIGVEYKDDNLDETCLK